MEKHQLQVSYRQLLGLRVYLLFTKGSCTPFPGSDVSNNAIKNIEFCYMSYINKTYFAVCLVVSSGGSWLSLMVGPAKQLLKCQKVPFIDYRISRCFSVNCYLGMHVNILIFDIGFLLKFAYCQIFSGAPMYKPPLVVSLSQFNIGARSHLYMFKCKHSTPACKRLSFTQVVFGKLFSISPLLVDAM